MYGYDTNLERWSDLGYEISLCSVLDEVSSSLSCIGTEIGDRSHIYKSCYHFIPLLQALVKILENLLWWLTWDLILSSAGLGNETGLKNLIHHALFIFIHQLCQHRFLWPCYKPVHESAWVKNSPSLGLFAFHYSYCSDAVTAAISKQLYQHVPCCWPETQDCPCLHYCQRWVVWNYSFDIRRGYAQTMTFWRKSWSYFEQTDFLQAI